IDEQYRPIFTHLSVPTQHPLTPALEPNAMRRSPECVRTGVGGIGEHIMDALIDRQLPNNVTSFWTIGSARQCNAFLPQPAVNLADALELGKLLEHQRDCLLHPPIRFLLDAVVRSSPV